MYNFIVVLVCAFVRAFKTMCCCMPYMFSLYILFTDPFNYTHNLGGALSRRSKSLSFTYTWCYSAKMIITNVTVFCLHSVYQLTFILILRSAQVNDFCSEIILLIRN